MALMCLVFHQKLSREAWRNIKGTYSQYILAAFSFDMKFTYMLAEWEGSAHDSQVLETAIDRQGFQYHHQVSYSFA